VKKKAGSPITRQKKKRPPIQFDKGKGKIPTFRRGKKELGAKARLLQRGKGIKREMTEK